MGLSFHLLCQCLFWREHCLLTMRFYKPLLLNLSARSIWQNEQLSKHMARGPRGAGPQRRGAQCSRIGCIGLRPALFVRNAIRAVNSGQLSLRMDMFLRSWTLECCNVLKIFNFQIQFQIWPTEKGFLIRCFKPIFCNNRTFLLITNRKLSPVLAKPATRGQLFSSETCLKVLLYSLRSVTSGMRAPISTYSAL